MNKARMNDSKEKAAPGILVTGAAGLSGSAVLREFEHQNVPVRGLIRNLNKKPSLALSSSVTYVEGDMSRADTLPAVLDGIERVLLISSSNPQMAETQCSFIDACKRAGVPHVIKFSGEESGIGFDPNKFVFGRMHEEIEDYLENSGLDWTHIRPSQFMQVYLRESASIKSQGAFFLPLEDIKLSPVDVEDIAKIAFALLQSGGFTSQSLRITGPQALSMAEIAGIIENEIGKKVSYVNISPGERRERLLAAGISIFMADALDEQGAERRRCPESRVDLTTHQLFGIEPTTFEEFVIRNAGVFK
jgi:uncharacterized protein YbjT (DUF2867 family)